MKMTLAAELARLARPENHAYTYHWETQNCSTLIRDLIDDSTNGSLKSLTETENPPTRRFEVLRHLGIYIGLGLGGITWRLLTVTIPMTDGHGCTFQKPYMTPLMRHI